MSDPHRIESVAALRAAIPEPSPVIHQKVFDRVDEYARAFIERAPFAMVATSDAEGRVDVSPKGDAPGFVTVMDEHTLVIPDRPGNKLAYGFRNLLENPRIGLIFLVPGVTETLRVNGGAEITRDPELLQRLAARGKPATLATRVRVEECFFHCGKAFIRAKLWEPASWPRGVRADLGKQMARKLGAGDELAGAIEDGLAKDYREGL